MHECRAATPAPGSPPSGVQRRRCRGHVRSRRGARARGDQHPRTCCSRRDGAVAAPTSPRSARAPAPTTPVRRCSRSPSAPPASPTPTSRSASARSRSPPDRAGRRLYEGITLDHDRQRPRPLAGHRDARRARQRGDRRPPRHPQQPVPPPRPAGAGDQAIFTTADGTSPTST